MRQRESDQPSSSSLAGVAPFDKQSGKSDPKRTTRGGRTGARTAGYMAALSAQRCNPIIKAFAAKLRCPTPLFSLSKRYYDMAYAGGFEKHDTAAVHAVLRAKKRVSAKRR